MKIRYAKQVLFVFVILLSACAKQAQPAQPTATLPPPTETPTLPTETIFAPTIEAPVEIFTETSVPPTEASSATPTEQPTEVPSSTDPLLFGALSKSEINPMASRIHEIIFTKVMDGFITNGNIIEYQLISSEVFPAGDGTFIAEFYYNVRTTDSSWLVDGGTQANDNWIQNKCNRFDFVNTETEFQLKNRRTCN